MPDYLALHRQRQLDELMRRQAPAMRRKFWADKTAQALEERRVNHARPWGLQQKP